MKSYDKMYNNSNEEYYTEPVIEDSNGNPLHDYEADFQNETSVSAEEPAEATLLKVANCNKAYIREAPTKESNQLTIVSKGDELLMEETSGDWYKVTTQTGVEGYIMKELTEL